MPAFHFKLDPLLRARRAREQQCQMALAPLLNEQRRLHHALRSCQEQVAGNKSTLRSTLVGPLNLDGLRSQAGASLQTMRHAQRLVLELAGVQRQIDAARRDLLEAARARRAVEVLRERRYAEWLAEQRKIEQNELDELATNRAARLRSSSPIQPPR